ncbi:MAG TPA: decaprenyl-phosphate phosphoribosyltransferase [Actinomycetes bacterium]
MVEAALAREEAGGGLIAALRPKQWVKNVLVAAAPLAAGAIFEPTVAVAVVVAFVAFSLAASAGYLVNDLADVEEDRRHPTKRLRPLASGRVSPRTAVVVAVLLAVASLGLAAALSTPGLVAVLAVYLVLTTSYSLWLKHQPVIDLAIVSSGFLLRAMAGGLASHIPLSQWFLIVAAFGSLFVVAGKRYSELVSHPDAGTRKSLDSYTPGYLRFVWSISAGVTITAYCLWAFQVDVNGTPVAWGPVSVAPFVLALLRYAVDVDHGRAGDPEQIVWSDRVLQALVLIWLVTFGIGAFGA